MRPLLIYIHGFLSSSLSAKAQETRHYLEQQALPIEFVAPELSNYPLTAYQQLLQVIESQPLRKIGLIGSSLGGFMATALAEQYGLRAVLVNPAVNPHKLIAGFLGEQFNPYTEQHFVLDQRHVQQLQRLQVQRITQPANIKVLLQTGDETLDYRQAVSYYQGCLQVVEQGGDHRFQHFDQHLAQAIEFLTLLD